MMDFGKITELNNSGREAIPHIRKLEEENPGVEIRISVLKFNTTAEWIVMNKPISEFKWIDIEAVQDGLTNVGQAFELLALFMNSKDMPERGFPPLVCLVTDGRATDSYKASLEAFLATRWGGKSIRQAIAIGQGADLSLLNKFINNVEIKPLQANNPEALAKAIRFVSTVALKQVSEPTKKDTTEPESAPIDPVSGGGSEDDVW